MKTKELLQSRYKLECKECGAEMVVDDFDFDFDGKGEIYYMCPKCGACVRASIRYGKFAHRNDWRWTKE